jgi:peptidoglycan/xylan/chitin deacetylase (PgdA/CDA1 family)
MMFVTLGYHLINRAISDKIAISEEAFEDQLRYLQNAGYTTLTLEQAIAIAHGKKEAAPRSVLLTFDDGYADNAQVALPRLLAYGMCATLFVISAYVGQSNRWNPKACYDVNHMTWHELRLWRESGCDIGGHSHRHLCMTRLTPDELEETVRVNKEQLEEMLHMPMRAFAYPYGMFNSLVRQAVARRYEVAFAVDAGSWEPQQDRYAINRLTVHPKWNLQEFARQLEKHAALAALRS